MLYLSAMPVTMISTLFDEEDEIGTMSYSVKQYQIQI
jgi:hypothetical protein